MSVRNAVRVAATVALLVGSLFLFRAGNVVIGLFVVAFAFFGSMSSMISQILRRVAGAHAEVLDSPYVGLALKAGTAGLLVFLFALCELTGTFVSRDVQRGAGLLVGSFAFVSLAVCIVIEDRRARERHRD